MTDKEQQEYDLLRERLQKLGKRPSPNASLSTLKAQYEALTNDSTGSEPASTGTREESSYCIQWYDS